ncbi:MAG: hypothetical protein AAB674_00930 [Patescibacteria group bacterium]
MEDNNPLELNADWIEAKDRPDQEQARNIRIYEFRFFVNTKSEFDFEGMGTFNVLDEGVILKVLMRRKGPGASTMTVYLQQNDGTWAKGGPNENYVSEMNLDRISDKESILTVILSLNTDAGVKKRIIVKKYKNPQI